MGMAGMGDEPEYGVAGEVQFNQMEQSLVDSEEDPVDLLAWYDQYLIVEMLVDDVSHLAGICVGVVLSDSDPVQALGPDRRHYSPHDVRGRIGTSRCLAAVGVEI